MTFDAVHLDGLTGRDMRDFPRCEGVGSVRHGFQLIGGQIPPLHFDSNHVFVGGVPDTVDPVFQPETPEIVGIERSRFERTDRLFKKLEFRFLGWA